MTTKRDYGTFGIEQRNGKFRARVHLPPTADGRYLKKSFTHESKVQVRKLAEAYLKSVALGVDVDAGSVSIAAYLDEWLTKFKESKKREGKPLARGTEANYERAVKRFIESIGKHPLNGLAPNVAEDAIWSQGASAEVARMRYTVLNLIITSALFENIIENNVLDRVKRPVGNTYKKPVILGPDEVWSIINAAGHTRYETPLTIQYMIGCRIGELFGLRWSDVDFENNKIRIERSVDRASGKLEFKDVKNHEARTLNVAPEVIEVLRAHRQVQRIEAMKTLAWNDEGLIFPDSIGGKWNYSNYRRGLVPIIERSGVTKDSTDSICTHAMRHACAAYLLSNKEDPRPIAEVSKYLGHRETRTTDRYYGDLLEDLSEAGAVMGGLLKFKSQSA